MSDLDGGVADHRFPGVDDADVAACLRGEKLYGDDFAADRIAAWFEEEEGAYFRLSVAGGGEYRYGYHALNRACGFRHLPARRFASVLGFGSAFGDEMLPIIDRIGHISIVEPGSGFGVRHMNGVPVTYTKPQPSGRLPFADGAFDLILCLGVLHHIPNVSAVVRELSRCAGTGGYVLIREPIISMGDWRRPRPGLTRHERGIPKPILRAMVERAGFTVVREQECMFPLTRRLRPFLQGPVFNSPLAVAIDRALCALPIWSRRYHPTSFLQKLRPAAVYYVLRKD